MVEGYQTFGIGRRKGEFLSRTDKHILGSQLRCV